MTRDIRARARELRSSATDALWVVLAVALPLAIALTVLEAVPHVQDEVVYELEARLLSEGRLFEHVRRPRASHPFEFIVNGSDGTERRYGAFPLGWPLVLALGVRLGAPWLVNPILHGVTVVLGRRLARRIGGTTAGALAGPLLALNPGLVLLAASRMSHTLVVLLAVSAAAILSGAPSRRRALLAGAALGAVWLVRPLDGLVASAAAAVAVFAWSRSRIWLWSCSTLALGPLLVLALNGFITGSPFVFPMTAYFAAGEPPFPGDGARYSAACDGLGFSPDHGCFRTGGSFGHDFGKALHGVLLNARLFWQNAFGWAPLAVTALPALSRPQGRRAVGGSVALWLVTASAYALYWYHGACFGARFHALAMPLVAIAWAVGIASVERAWPRRLLAALGVVTMMGRLWGAVPELRGYWGVDGRLARYEALWGGEPALVLVDYGRPLYRRVGLSHTGEGETYYPSLLLRSLWIERRAGPTVYAEYDPRLVEATRARYPGVPVWVLVLHLDRRADYYYRYPGPRVPQDVDLPIPKPWRDHADDLRSTR